MRSKVDLVFLIHTQKYTGHIAVRKPANMLTTTQNPTHSLRREEKEVAAAIAAVVVVQAYRHMLFVLPVRLAMAALMAIN